VASSKTQIPFPETLSRNIKTQVKLFATPLSRNIKTQGKLFATPPPSKLNKSK
jgi:hypothetical protein